MNTVVEPSGRGLGAALRDASPLLVSVALLMAGGGLLATLLGVRAGLEGFRPSVIGVVLAGYYAGYLGGSLLAPSAIEGVGHVRVFAGLAALASGAVLMHVVFIEPVTWFILRAVVGLCISALYVVCETWLNGVATNRSRGGLLATYMVVVSGSLLIGQLLFSLVGPDGFVPFILASILVSLAVVPVSLVAFPAPALPDPGSISVRRIIEIAPLAALGAAVSGFIGAAMLSAGVVFASAAGFNRFATGAFVGAALAGGVLLQLPLGSWSDKVDRRLVIAVTATAAAVVAVVASLVSTDRRIVLIALTAVAGGSAFPIYSLSVGHLNDYLDDACRVAAGARMVLINGVGAILGPIVGSMAIGLVSPGSMFIVLAAAYAVVAGFAVFRMTRRAAPDEAERAAFTPSTVGVGPTTLMAGEDDVVELYPVDEGTAELDARIVPYREQGVGPTVVLIGDPIDSDEPGAPTDMGAELLVPLAADGIRAIVPQVDPGIDPDGDGVLDAIFAVMRHLEISSATFVGDGAGVEIVLRLARDHADRTDGVVILGGSGALAPTGLEAAHGLVQPLMVLDRRPPFDAPSEVADDIAQFTRLLPTNSYSDPVTGRVDVVDG